MGRHATGVPALLENDPVLAAVIQINERIVKNGKLIAGLPDPKKAQTPVAIVDIHNRLLTQHSGILYESSLLKSSRAPYRDSPSRHSFAVIEEIIAREDGNPVLVVRTQAPDGKIIFTTLNADEMKTIESAPEARNVIAPHSSFYAKEIGSQEVTLSNGVKVGDYQTVVYKFRIGNTEYDKVGKIEGILIPNDRPPLIQISEVGADGNDLYRYLTDHEMLTIKPLNSFADARAPKGLRRVLSGNRFIGSDGEIITPGDKITFNRNDVSEHDIQSYSKAIYKGVEYDSGSITLRTEGYKTKENVRVARRSDSQTTNLARSQRKAEKKRMKSLPPEGYSRKVTEIKADDISGDGFIFFSSIKDTGRSGFEGGQLEEFIVLFPRRAKELGMSFHDGILGYPDTRAINARLRKDPDWNGLEFVADKTGKMATLSQYIRDLADGKVVYIDRGSLHFHDFGNHGVGYTSFPKSLVGTFRRKAKVLLREELEESKWGKELVDEFDDLSATVKRHLIGNDPIAMKAAYKKAIRRLHLDIDDSEVTLNRLVAETWAKVHQPLPPWFK